MVSTTRLYIPPRTYLQTVWRVVHGDGRVTYQAWTACHDRNAPFHQMLGTHLALHDSGAISRVSIRPNDEVHIMDVMPPYKETDK